MKAWLFTILRNAFYEQRAPPQAERAALERHAARSRLPRISRTSARTRDLHASSAVAADCCARRWCWSGAQELTYEEAAAICDVPVGTMKARVSRARRQLARLADPLHADPAEPA